MSGESCPENTIPILRKTKEEEENALNVTKSIADPLQASIVFAKGAFYGASAKMQVWQPIVKYGDASMSQITLSAGGGVNYITAGLHIVPSRYNNNKKEDPHTPRIFAYWTDSSGVQGCINYDCKKNYGFVGKSHKVMLEGAVSPSSKFGGAMAEIPFTIHKEKKENEDWWLYIKGVPVGYWQSINFRSLSKFPAENVQIGGQVVSHNARTTTQMGSGHFPKEGFTKAAAFRDIHVLNKNWENIDKVKWKPVTPKGQDKCWYSTDVKFTKFTDGNGNYFLYGGPGCA